MMLNIQYVVYKESLDNSGLGYNYHVIRVYILQVRKSKCNGERLI